MDVFFVISGFVVTPLILRIFNDSANGGKWITNLRYFYSRRFYRLAPALAATLSISAISILLLGPMSDHPKFIRQGIATLLLLGNLGALRYSGDYFLPNPNPLVHTWSLSVEEQIYILLPLVLLIFLHKRRRMKKITAVVFGLISTISFISFLFPTILQSFFSRADIAIPSNFSFYSPIDRIWQFTFGGLAFLVLGRYQNFEKRIPKTINKLTVISVIILLFGPINLSIKVSSILASLIALTIVVFKSLNVFPGVLISILEWMGDRSYSIYLVHMPLLYIAKNSPVTKIGNDEDRIAQSIIAMIISILLGALMYSKIENRYRNKGKTEATLSRGIWKVFTFVFIVPLAMLLFLSKISGSNDTSMYEDRFDNGMCKFWTPNIDEKFLSRFLWCQSKFGRATVILGDSHAMNIYNALYLTTRREFFVGIANGGCRPNTESKNCHYADFKKLLKSSPNSFEKVIFHQSGSYLISDENGSVDSNLAFKSHDSYSIVDDDIQFLLHYLNDMERYVATTWIGPFSELRVDPALIQVKTNRVKPNPIVREAFMDLEKQIAFYLKKENSTFRYVSLSEALGNKQYEYKVGSCILFRDTDHWSLCGEKMFALPIDKNLQG